MDHADVVVIGAGVIGTSIALELARSGREVVVLDKAGGAGHGSTGASSGIVRFHYSTFAGVALAWESVHGWQDWAGHLRCEDAAALAGFARTGILVLEPSPGALDTIHSLLDAVRVPWEQWEHDDIARRLPHLDGGHYGPPTPVRSQEFFAPASGRLRGSFTPDAGHVADPQLAAQNLADAAMREGARFCFNTEVASLATDGPRRWRVRTASGSDVAADVVVNAAGPWSSKVNDLAGAGSEFSVSSRPLRQEVHEVPAPPGFEPGPGRPGITVADADLGVYVRSAGPGRLLIGGLEPECDPLEWLDDPDTVDPRPSARAFEAQVTRAARRFPELTIPHRPCGIAGVYDATTDWAPIYDRTDLPGFYVAMGTSGNQFKNAPVVGALMRALIDAVEGGHDHDAAPVRVRLPRTGIEFDLSAYSRLRPIAVGAPASVMG